MIEDNVFRRLADFMTNVITMKRNRNKTKTDPSKLVLLDYTCSTV